MLARVLVIASSAVLFSACSDSSVVTATERVETNPKAKMETIAPPPPKTVNLSSLLAYDFSDAIKHKKKPANPAYDEFDKAVVIEFGCVRISDYLRNNSACPEIRWRLGQRPRFYVRLGFFGGDWIYLEGAAFAIGEHSSALSFQWESAFGQIVKDAIKGVVVTEHRSIDISEKEDLITAFATDHRAKVRLLGKAMYLDFPLGNSERQEFSALASFFMENKEKLLEN